MNSSSHNNSEPILLSIGHHKGTYKDEYRIADLEEVNSILFNARTQKIERTFKEARVLDLVMKAAAHTQLAPKQIQANNKRTRSAKDKGQATQVKKHL